MLDHGVEQRILFQGYSTPNIYRVMPLWKLNFLFPANSYNLHPIKLKLCKYLHYDVEQCIVFRGYSTPNIYRVMPH